MAGGKTSTAIYALDNGRTGFYRLYPHTLRLLAGSDWKDQRLAYYAPRTTAERVSRSARLDGSRRPGLLVVAGFAAAVRRR